MSPTPRFSLSQGTILVYIGVDFQPGLFNAWLDKGDYPNYCVIVCSAATFPVLITDRPISAKIALYNDQTVI